MRRDDDIPWLVLLLCLSGLFGRDGRRAARWLARSRRGRRVERDQATASAASGNSAATSGTAPRPGPWSITDAAQPGAEGVAEVEGGDVEGGGEALAGALRLLAAPTSAAARRWRRRRRRAGRRRSPPRPGCGWRRPWPASTRASAARVPRTVGTSARSASRPPSRLPTTQAAAEHQQDRRDRGFREAGDLGQERRDVGEDGEDAGIAEHGREQAEQHGAAAEHGELARANRLVAVGRLVGRHEQRDDGEGQRCRPA